MNRVSESQLNQGPVSPADFVEHIINNDLKAVEEVFLAAPSNLRKEYLSYVTVSNRNSPLEYAIQTRNPEMVDFLLSHHEGVPINNRAVWNACHLLMRNTQDADQAEAIFSTLVSHGVGREGMAGLCWGPAHIAISANRKDAPRALKQLDLLAQHGFDLDQVDEVGETPLAVACWHLMEPVARHLIEQGSNLRFKTRGGRSVVNFILRESDEKSSDPDVMNRMAKMILLLDDANYDFTDDYSPENMSRAVKGWRPEQAARFPVLIESVLVNRQLENDTPPAEGSKQPGRAPRL